MTDTSRWDSFIWPFLFRWDAFIWQSKSNKFSVYTVRTGKDTSSSSSSSSCNSFPPPSPYWGIMCIDDFPKHKLLDETLIVAAWQRSTVSSLTKPQSSVQNWLLRSRIVCSLARTMNQNWNYGLWSLCPSYMLVFKTHHFIVTLNFLATIVDVVSSYAVVTDCCSSMCKTCFCDTL